MYQPRSSLYTIRISLGFMINARVHLASKMCLIFDGPVIGLWLTWEEFVRYQVRANEIYSEAKSQFSVRNRDVLMNAQSPHKLWCSTPVRHCLHLLAGVVEKCANRLVRMVCCRII